MRICDRCGSESVKEVVHLSMEKTEVDLCGPCVDAFRAFLVLPDPAPPARRGRKHG